jgi:hypothetical protein
MKATGPVTFTALLYSVVIGVAFQNISSLAWSEKNLLMVLALLVVFDDYFLYHHDIKKVPDTGPNQIFVFWADIAVLAMWYGVSLATAYGHAVFFGYVAGFYGLTTFWEAITASRGSRLESALNGGLIVCLVASAIALVCLAVGDWANAMVIQWSLTAVFAAITALIRLGSYRRIWLARSGRSAARDATHGFTTEPVVVPTSPIPPARTKAAAKGSRVAPKKPDPTTS